MPGRNKILSALGFVVVLVLAILLGQRYDTVRNIISSPQPQNYRPDFNGDGQVIGIEFGNNTYRVGVQRNGTFEIIPDAQGRTETPSCVLFRNNLVLVGYDANLGPLQVPENTVCGIRQVIGREFSEPQLRTDIENLSYSVKNRNGKPVVQVWRNGAQSVFTPEEVLAESLRKLKADAETYLDEPVTRAVITVPSHFNDLQRQATKDAGFLAGLDVLRLINEPTAAALAHKLDERSEYSNDEAFILAYDIQETAISVTISILDTGLYEIIAQATTGELGGRDLDSALLRFIAAKYNDAQHRDITRDAGAMGRLHYETHKAEAALSANTSAKIEIQPRKHASNFSNTVTPDSFHDLHERLFQRTTGTIKQALSQAKVSRQNIHHIIMTGDPARTSKLRPYLSTFLGGKEILHDEFLSNEAFVRGAASMAAILFGDEVDVGFFGIDIAPLSLGIGTADGIVKWIIPRNTVIPTRKTQVFLTVTDDQSSVILEILEGARPAIKDNIKLGVLELNGIRRADAGIPRIEVVFEVDPNAILTVIARELETENEVKVVVPNRRGEEYGREVEAMSMDAETNYELDLEFEKAALHSWLSRPINPVGVIPLRDV